MPIKIYDSAFKIPLKIAVALFVGTGIGCGLGFGFEKIFKFSQFQISHRATGEKSFASTSGGIGYGDRTPECLHPVVEHLCSEYSALSEMSTATHYLSFTCEDSCGNIYAFESIVRLHATKEGSVWGGDSGFGPELGPENHFVVLQRGTQSEQTQSEKDSLDKEKADIASQRQVLAQQAALIWSQAIAQFPVAPVKIRSSSELSQGVDQALANPSEVTGQVTWLANFTTQLRSQLSQAGDNFDLTETLGNEIIIVQYVIDFLVDNEFSLIGTPSPRLNGLYDLTDNASLVFSFLRFRSSLPQTAGFISYLASNVNLQNILASDRQLNQKERDRMKKEEDWEKSQDPSSQDADKTERCLDPALTSYEVFPKQGLLPVLTALNEDFKKEMKTMGPSAKEFCSNYVGALQETGNPNAADYLRSPESCQSVVLIKDEDGAFSEKNKWTVKTFEALEREGDAAKRIDLFNKLKSCSSFEFAPGTHLNASMAKPDRPRYSRPIVTDTNLYFTNTRKVGDSRLLFEVAMLPGGKPVAAIYIFDPPGHAAVTPLQICNAMVGYCSDPRFDVHLGKNLSDPYLTLEMPLGGSLPPRLKTRISHVTQPDFIDLMKKAGFSF